MPPAVSRLLLIPHGDSENDPRRGLTRVDSNNSMSSSITLDSDKSVLSLKGNNNYNNVNENNQRELRKEKEREKEILLKVDLESMERDLKVT